MNARQQRHGRPSLRRAALVLLGVTLVAFGPFLYYTVVRGGSCWGFHDWPQFWSWYDLPRIALVEYGQLDFWNPYVGGGIPGFGHTHDPTFSPILLVTLVFGTITGTRLVVVAWTYLGMLSMFALARRFGVKRLGCYLAAVVWGLNGHHMLHLLVGHIEHTAMAFLPLVALLFLQERRRGTNAILSALLIAALFLGGAAYAVCHAALMVALLALLLTILERSPRWFGRLIVVGGGAALLAAVKLVAAVPFVMNRVPPMKDVTGTGIGFLWRRLISPKPAWIMPGEGRLTVGFWELGAYVGIVAVALFAVGVFVAARRVRKRDWDETGALSGKHLIALVVTSLVFLLLSFGSRGPLFSLLRHVPVLGAMHVPFRFVTVPLMALSLLAGMGLDGLVRRVRSGTVTARWARAAALGVIVVVAADLAWAHQYLVRAAFAVDEVNEADGKAVVSDVSWLLGYETKTGRRIVADVEPFVKKEEENKWFETRLKTYPTPPEPGSREWVDHYVIQPHAAARYLMHLQGRGNPASYEMLYLPTAVRWVGGPGYRGEVYLRNTPEWEPEPEQVTFTPSRITVTATFPADDVLALNQNMYGGWHVTIDGRTERVATGAGTVSADVPAGQHTVVFWFRPDGFWLALGVSVGSLLGIGIRAVIVRQRDSAGQGERHERQDMSSVRAGSVD